MERLGGGSLPITYTIQLDTIFCFGISMQTKTFCDICKDYRSVVDHVCHTTLKSPLGHHIPQLLETVYPLVNNSAPLPVKTSDPACIVCK